MLHLVLLNLNFRCVCGGGGGEKGIEQSLFLISSPFSWKFEKLYGFTRPDFSKTISFIKLGLQLRFPNKTKQQQKRGVNTRL